jgi:hypothetical protein
MEAFILLDRSFKLIFIQIIIKGKRSVGVTINPLRSMKFRFRVFRIISAVQMFPSF